MRKKPELLAPAGGYEALIAAVQSGADAVYMGFGAFNARRSAKNFTDEEFASAVAYCHLRGVRVFLTLNTLLTDRELEQAAESLRKASDMGVDAILVQDWGLLTLAREIVPDVPLHASTQMSLFTLGGTAGADLAYLIAGQLAGQHHPLHAKALRPARAAGGEQAHLRAGVKRQVRHDLLCQGQQAPVLHQHGVHPETAGRPGGI